MHVYFRKAGLLDGGGGAGVNTAPIDVCRPPRGADALDELAHFPPFLSRFLWAFACSRYNPPSNTARKHPGRLLQRDGDEAGWKNFDIRHRDGEAVRVLARRAVRLLAPGHFIVEDSLHGLQVSAREPGVRET